jgi:hypothetical protein
LKIRFDRAYLDRDWDTETKIPFFIFTFSLFVAGFFSWEKLQKVLSKSKQISTPKLVDIVLKKSRIFADFAWERILQEKYI